MRMRQSEAVWYELGETMCNSNDPPNEMCLYEHVNKPFHYRQYRGCVIDRPAYGIWSELRVVARLDKIEIYQNGSKTCSYTAGTPILFGGIIIEGTGRVLIEKVLIEWMPYGQTDNGT